MSHQKKKIAQNQSIQQSHRFLKNPQIFTTSFILFMQAQDKKKIYPIEPSNLNPFHISSLILFVRPLY